MDTLDDRMNSFLMCHAWKSLDLIICHISFVQKVHGNGERHYLFQQGVAPQNGAELDIQPLKQYRTAYDAGVKAGTVKGVLRRPQELKDQFRL